jgi:serine/threonine protein kinase
LLSYTETEDEHVLYMEYANKGFYLTELIHDQHTPIEDEDLLRKWVRDILEGLAYIHSHGIIHGDVKLPNILCHEENDVIKVKICDFGFCHLVDPKKENKVVIHDVCGTMGHIAPEVKSHCSIGTEVDIWCFGLMLYEMAVAYKPTQIKNFSYSDGDIPFRKIDWRRKSPELMDLIQLCMKYEPEERISAEEALKHPWFFPELK